MRQNDHNSLSPRPRFFSSRSRVNIARLTACAAVVCLSLAVMTPAHALKGATPTQAKKDKKKDKTPPPSKTTTKTPAETPRVILVFPPETKGGVSDQIADAITDVVQSRLDLSGKYKTTSFLPSSPIVRRAVIEGTVAKADVDHPTSNDALIKKLTELTNHDMAVVVSIIDYQFDKAANKVSMVMSAKIVDYTGPAPRGTNRNGDSPEKPSPKATEYDLASALARDLTEKMITDLLAAKKPTDAK